MRPRLRQRSIFRLKAVSPLLGPILLAAYPVVTLFQHNQSDIDLRVLWKNLALAAASAVILFVLLRLAFRRGAKAGVLTSLAVVCSSTTGPSRRMFPDGA